MPLFVNNKKISEDTIKTEMEKMRSDFKKSYPDMDETLQEKTLFEWAQENIAERELLKDYVKGREFDINETNVENEINKIRKNFESDKEFRKSLNSQGKDLNKLKNEVRQKLKIEKLLENLKEEGDSFSKKDLRMYYQKNKQDYTIPEQVKVKHIVNYVKQDDTENEALNCISKAKKEVDSGSAFEEVGKKFSDCEQIDLGYFPKGKMVESFEEVVFDLDEGEVSDVFRTKFGYHIAKLYDRKPPQQLQFDEVKDTVKENYIEDKQATKVNEFVDKLKEEADISYEEPEDITESAQAGFKLTKPLRFMLIKPAGPDCNLRCDYCFYLDKKEMMDSEQHRMSEEVLKNMTKKAIKNNPNNINFGWQGGEPTLMGIDFYKKAIEYQNEYSRPNQQIGNSLQTNGILIDEEWTEFLKENEILVGLSLDGKKHIHDKYRKYKNGKGSHEEVEKTAKMLLDNEVAVNALSAVNDYSVQYPEETFRYLTSLGFEYLQFIPILELKEDRETLEDYSVSPEQYGEFLCDIFDVWQEYFENGRPTVSVRFFETVFHKYLNREAPECFLREECGNYVVVEHDGEMYACDFFVEPEWKLGNVKNTNPIAALNSEKQAEFGKMKSELPEECWNCKWLEYCRGGCTKDRMNSTINEKRTHFCKSYKMFFEHSDETFNGLAEDFKDSMGS